MIGCRKVLKSRLSNSINSINDSIMTNPVRLSRRFHSLGAIQINEINRENKRIGCKQIVGNKMIAAQSSTGRKSCSTIFTTINQREMFMSTTTITTGANNGVATGTGAGAKETGASSTSVSASTNEKQKNRLFMPSSYYQDLSNLMMKKNHSSSPQTNPDQDESSLSTHDRNVNHYYTPKQIQKSEAHYILYIYAGRNNTHVHLSLASTGNTIAQASAGMLGLKKAARSSSDAGFNTTALLLKKLNELKVPGFVSISTTPVSADSKDSPSTGKGKARNYTSKYNVSSAPSIHVKLKGFGKGREQAFRALKDAALVELNIVRISDCTPLRHGGCRARKPRRL